MSGEAMNEIPVYLFTGFLEAGKTKFITETMQDENFNDKKKKYLILRTVEIVLMGLVGYLVPSFYDVLSLIGNFTDVLTTFIFPAVMHIVFFRNRTSSTIMGLDMATLVISVIIMIICTSLSLKNFFKK